MSENAPATEQPEAVMAKRRKYAIALAVVIVLTGLIALAAWYYVHRWPGLRYIGSTGSISAKGVRRVRFSPDGRLLAVVYLDRSVHLWSADDLASLGSFRLPEDPGVGITFIPRTPFVAVGGREGTIVLWDVQQKRQRWSKKLHGGIVLDIVAAADGRRGFSSGHDGVNDAGYGGAIIEWDVATGEEVRNYGEFERMPWPLALSPDQRTLAASVDNATRLFNVEDASEDAELGPSGARALAFSRDGALLAETHFDGVTVRDVQTGAHRHRMTDRPDAGYSEVRFSPDGAFVAAGSRDCASVWSLATGEVIARGPGGPMDLSPDGTVLAIAPRSEPRIDCYRLTANPGPPNHPRQQR